MPGGAGGGPGGGGGGAAAGAGEAEEGSGGELRAVVVGCRCGGELGAHVSKANPCRTLELLGSLV